MYIPLPLYVYTSPTLRIYLSHFTYIRLFSRLFFHFPFFTFHFLFPLFS